MTEQVIIVVCLFVTGISLGIIAGCWGAYLIEFLVDWLNDN